MDLKTHHTIEIPEKNHIFYTPKELAYCDGEEYVKVCEKLYRWHCGDISLHDFYIQAIYILLKLKKGNRQIGENDQLHMLCNLEFIAAQCIGTFFNPKKEGYEVKLNFVKNHILKFTHRKAIYHGPEDRFKNVKWGQYKDALNLYHMYHKTLDKRYLKYLFAIFYLPKGKKYKPNQTEKNAEKFNTLNSGYLYGFFLLFSAMQLYITTAKLFHEGREISLSLLFESEPGEDKFESKIPGLGLKALTYQIAETSIFGDEKKVNEMPMWDVLFLMYELRKRDLDNLEKMEKIKK